MWTDAGVPGRDVVESERWGVAPSVAFGLGTPTRLTAQLLPPGAGQPARVRAAVGAGQHQPRTGRVRQRPRRRSIRELLRPDDARLRGHRQRHRHGAARSPTSARASTLRNLTRYGETIRDSVITSPRFVSVNTSTAINRQLQSRDMIDDIVANQTNLTARFDTGRSPMRWSPASSSRARGRRTSARTGPDGADGRSLRTRIRTIRTPGRSPAPARAPPASAGSVAAVRLRHR